jgi:hypothetical protein
MRQTKDLFERIAATGTLLIVDPVGYEVRIPHGFRKPEPSLLEEMKLHKREIVEAVTKYGVVWGESEIYAWALEHYGVRPKV